MNEAIFHSPACFHFMALRVRYLNGRGCGGPTYRTFEPGRTFNAVLYIGCMDSKG